VSLLAPTPLVPGALPVRPMAGTGVAPLPTVLWSVADAVDGDAAWLYLDPDDPIWSGGTTAVEWRVGTGAPQSLSPVLPGAHRITGLTPGASAGISIRATQNGVISAWSAARPVTPTAASMTRFAVWSDAAHSADLSAYPAVTRIGEVTASTGAINKPLALSTGEEIEYVGGAGSLWVAHYGGVEFPGATLADLEVRHRFFEPGGRHADLAPLATRAIPFKLRATGDGADQSATALILGAAGVATQPGMAAVALDADGDPVEFRFDRLHEIGMLRDGRPFVVAPAGVALIANGGKQTIPVNRVATWRGASLCVVASAGLIPLVETAVTLTTAYARVLAEPSWASWPVAAAGAGALTIQRQPESLHIYLQSASATATEVRFRKSGATAWNPAQPLVYDDRVPVALMAPVVPGNHRGVILHLEPDTAYEVQVMQGTDRYDAFERTLSLKPIKVSAALGAWSDVDVTITRSGSTVTATPSVGSPVSIALPPVVSDVTSLATMTVESAYTEGPAGTYTVNTASTTNSLYWDFSGIVAFKPGERMRVTATLNSLGGRFRFEPRVGATIVSSHAATFDDGVIAYDFVIPAGAENTFNLRIRALSATLNSTVSAVKIERLDAQTYAEFHSGLVRGGGITINATGVILRDVDVIAPPASAIVFASGARDIRIVRGAISGWARDDIGVKVNTVGWGRQHDAAVELCREHTDNSDVMLIGLRTRFPRHHANTWEHWNPSVGTPAEGQGSHPYGPNFISVKQGSFLGGVYISGCSFAGDKRRPVEDSITGNNNKTREIGGLGPNSWMGHCYMTGMADDGLEIEGSNQCAVLLANWLDLKRVANMTRSPRSGVSCSTGYWGPTILARNVFRFTRDGFVGPVGQNDQSSVIKAQKTPGSSGIVNTEQRGLIVFAHNTGFTPEIGNEPRNIFSNSASAVGPAPGPEFSGWLAERFWNNLGRQGPIDAPADAYAAPSGVDVVVAGNDVARQSVSPLPNMVEGTHIPVAYEGGGVVLDNLNDAGPWATASAPSAGAAEVGA